MPVIIFSTKFPSYHPKTGQPTHFVEKFWESLIHAELISLSKMCELSRQTGVGRLDMNSVRKSKFDPKHHTIRAGRRWKVGQKFSPRIWSGKPYDSKQIIIGPDIEIVKTFDFKICPAYFNINGREYDCEVESHFELLDEIAKNDGLDRHDLCDWFFKSGVTNKQPFDGQIICWNPNINY